MTRDIDPFAPLSARQAAILVGIGVVIWPLVAMSLAALDRIGAYHGTPNMLLYALIVPGTVPLILLIRTLAGARREQTLLCVAIVTATASLLDGNALLRLPSLYGDNTAGAGAALLWGVGVALTLGVLMNRAERTQPFSG